MSQLRTNSIVPVGGIPAGASGGGIVQCVSTTKTDYFNMTGTTYTDVTGLSATITPRSTSNKILIIVNLNFNGASSYNAFFNLVRDSTNIAQGTGSATYNMTGAMYEQTDNQYSNIFNNQHFLDSPATTSSTTYKIQVRSSSAGQAVYVNRRTADTFVSVVSSITAMEISG